MTHVVTLKGGEHDGKELQLDDSTFNSGIVRLLPKLSPRIIAFNPARQANKSITLCLYVKSETHKYLWEAV